MICIMKIEQICLEVNLTVSTINMEVTINFVNASKYVYLNSLFIRNLYI